MMLQDVWANVTTGYEQISIFLAVFFFLHFWYLMHHQLGDKSSAACEEIINTCC